MKRLILIFLTTFYVCGCGLVAGEKTQAHTTDRNAPDRQTVKVEAAALTLSLPVQFEAADTDIKFGGKGEVEWTTSRFKWTKPGQPRYEAEVFVTDWSPDFRRVRPGLSNPTPEELLALEVAADQRRRDTGGRYFKEAGYLEIDGVKGGFFRTGRHLGDGDLIMIGWYAYRYHRGKAQEIGISVQGKEEDLEEMMQIIKSAKFERK